MRPSLAGTLALALLAACAPATRGPDSAGAGAGKQPPAHRRAILVSFDAMNEQRALGTVPAASIPVLRALFAQAACADYALPAWPSKTSPSHASLWTGAYGDVNGIAANWQPRLPRREHAITEGISGYSPAALRAEPIWVTAVRAGRRVFAHHPTQALGPLHDPGAVVLNGYDTSHGEDLAITPASAPPRPPQGWRGLNALGSTVAPKEIAWTAGGDSVFALLYGKGRYEAVLAALSRDVARGVTARLAPAERAPVAGRELARHFSEPLALDAAGGRAWLRVRLFALAADGSDFLIFQPALAIVGSNHPAEALAYGEAIGGWVGNGAQDLLADGDLGRTLPDGGDGEAERRYLESLELVTRQFMRGSEWGWGRDPDLMVDYFPLADEVDHMWYGFLAPGLPERDEALARALAPLRARAWELIDQRLAHLSGLAAKGGHTLLLVSGDHGMRPTWRAFRPNAALRDAGLLALDDSARVDPHRTRAYSPDGLYITVNTTDWLDGIVPADSVAAVVEAAERAIRAVRGSDGQPVVTETWRVTGADSLGRGGPAGGQLYYETAAGYVWSRDARGEAAGPARSGADHGFPSTSPDMHTILCAAADSIPPHRIGPARTIDAAPTVSAWLGIPPPHDARGRSLLEQMLDPRTRIPNRRAP